jgi:hypothetical protein
LVFLHGNASRGGAGVACFIGLLLGFVKLVLA